jgi:uncharacterized protein YceH (UPF0502 family)
MSAIEGSGWTVRSKCPICNKPFKTCLHVYAQVEAWFSGNWPPRRSAEARFKSLEAKVEELEAKVAELEKRVAAGEASA